jgi:hypothetical protein
MREPLTYYLLVWRRRDLGLPCTETFTDLDEACAEFDGRTDFPWEFVTAVMVVDRPEGALIAPLNIRHATEAWLRDKEDDAREHARTIAAVRRGMV